MKTIMITAPQSNEGKTLITLGLIRAFKNRGLDVSAFKAGPDFVDTSYLALASRKRAGNLDMHMMGEEGIEKAISMNKGEYGVVEGAMGYFDGIYNTFENSSYHISNMLNINAILVYTPKGEMFSVVPKIKGMVDFPKSKIKGIIFNKVNKSTYVLLKEIVEEHIGIKVLGYIESHEELNLGEGYRGLVQSMENKDAEGIIERTAEILVKTVDLDGIIKLMKDLKVSDYQYPKKRDIKVAIAYDEAFLFYYSENLKLLENICDVEYFSPIKDKEVPKFDLLYIGGGYPELYKEELSQNKTMINSIRKMAEEGGHIYAESGGFMYLVEDIEGYPMVGILKGKAHMTDRLQRFGYSNIRLREDTILGKKGERLKANEFHRSAIEIEDRPLFDIKKAKSERGWQCGYGYKNVLAAYPHINFLGNMKALNYLLDRIEKER
ncbi:cobyrinate a,c-diamide synthase [Tepidimicrobium xylanilyticum]|uniref:cobyrinate a,c-diamide synthase n=1 Tax=Tepidimicrobium xylanilyticum TaxID=1123352 RepID=UPI002655A5FA|nr:cobyrinate a,c-diamide synthase [Tepidimicrobium xylanilyticum]GMG95937.1 cobyrinate a,c-diamide synthase [Tepidimicrobium xylanilyticum]